VILFVYWLGASILPLNGWSPIDGYMLVLLLAGLSSAQVAPSRIIDGRHQAGDIEPGV
jgi:hypothetical protein